MVIELELDQPLAVCETFELEREYAPHAMLGEHIAIDVKSQHCIGLVVGITADLVKVKVLRVYGGGV